MPKVSLRPLPSRLQCMSHWPELCPVVTLAARQAGKGDSRSAMNKTLYSGSRRRRGDGYRVGASRVCCPTLLEMGVGYRKASWARVAAAPHTHAGFACMRRLSQKEEFRSVFERCFFNMALLTQHVYSTTDMVSDSMGFAAREEDFSPLFLPSVSSLNLYLSVPLDLA